jgi:hypothetical protein
MDMAVLSMPAAAKMVVTSLEATAFDTICRISGSVIAGSANYGNLTAGAMWD